MNSVCIKIRKGDPVQERYGKKRKGWVDNFELSPNGRDDPGLVAILHVLFEDGGSKIATSDKFVPIDDYDYDKFYPSEMFTR